MNTKTVVISATTFLPVIYLNSITLVDMTNLSFNLSNIPCGRDPIVIEFDWYGNRSVTNTYTAHPVKGFGALLSTFTQLSAKTYDYMYLPGENTLVKSFSCIIKYTNLVFNNRAAVNSYAVTIIQPITIFAPSFYNKIGDMDILQTNIINSSVLITLGTAANGGVIETLLPL